MLMRHPRTPWPGAGAALPALLASLALGACGDDDPSGGSASPPAATDQAKLTIVVRDEPSADPSTTTVDCTAGGADADTPPCPDALRLTPEDFAPTPADTACTEIYGGPETASIEGTVDGQEVQATITRANGCEIDRWETIVAPLGAG